MMTTSRKRWGATAAAGTAAAVLLAIAFAAMLDGNHETAVAFWTGLFGLGLAVASFVGFWEADCPSCGRAAPFTDAAYQRCAHCRRYAKKLPKGLEALPEDFVAPAPVFGIPVGEAALPGACCVCRAPATRRTCLTSKLEDTLPSKSAAQTAKKDAARGVGLRPTLTVSVEVPHCAAHEAEARIDVDQTDSFAGATAQVVVRVRSYPFYRAALGLN